MSAAEAKSVDPFYPRGAAAPLRAELARLEGCGPLVRAPMLVRLLRYLFEETIAGRGACVSQYSIAFDCYGIGEGFDPAANSIVRVHARRLRKLLDELAHPSGACRILMPERGYELRFEAGDSSPAAGWQHEVPSDRPVVGIFEFNAVADQGAHLVRGLSEEIMAALGTQDLAMPAGPFATGASGSAAAVPYEVDATGRFDLRLQGALLPASNGWGVSVRLLDGAGHHVVGSFVEPIGDMDPDEIRSVASRIVARVFGDWGLVARWLVASARAKSGVSLGAYEALALARQYLTHYDFEQLDACVAALRRAAPSAATAALPATLAVLLAVIVAVEPRWSEPPDCTEIGRLAAQASRLDPQHPWTRLALAMAAAVEGRPAELHGMALRAELEPDTPLLLVGGLGILLCYQAIDLDLGSRMVRRFCSEVPDYPRMTHLALALAALAKGDTRAVTAELACFGVPWGWASPLLRAACLALEGHAAEANAEWERVLVAFPGFVQRWRGSLGLLWHEIHLVRIAEALEGCGVGVDLPLSK